MVTVTLRPLRLVELLDQAFRLYRRNFLRFTAIVAAPMILAILLMTVPLALFAPFLLQDQLQSLGWQVPVTLSIFSLLGGVALAYVIMLVAGVLMQSLAPAAIARAVTDACFGKPVSILGAYRQIGPHWLRLLGAVGLLLIVVTGFSLASGMAGSVLPCIPLLLMPVQYSAMILIQGLILPLVPPVVVIERQGVWRAIRRAWELARRRFWRMLGFMALLFALNVFLIMGPSLLIMIVLQFVSAPIAEAGNPGAQIALTAVIAMLAMVILQLLFLSFQWTGITLMYFDLRVRCEGLDLALQAASNAEEADLEQIMTQSPSFEGTSLITWREVGYLTIICVGVFALCLIPVLVLILIGIATLPLL
jgi:hypothetical protein